MPVRTLQVELHPAELPVVAGQPVVVRVDILNTSTVIDAYRVRILGLDPAWVETDPASLSLFPGATGSVTAIVTLPDRFAAGTHRFSVQVYSERDDAEYQLVDLRLHVGEVERLDARLEPPVMTVSRRARFGLVLTNNGNAEVAVRPEATDAEDALQVAFEPALALVGPGQQTVIEVTARGRRPWFGTPVARQLAVAVAGNTVRQELHGTLLQRPRFSRGLMALLGLLVAASVFGLVLSSVFGDVLDAAKVDHELLKAAMDDGAEDGAAVAAAPTAVAGRVTVVGTGTGVSGVTVELYAAGDDKVPKATAATDEEGTYAFNNVPAGTYRLRFVGAGYLETWFPDALGFDTAQDVEVEAGASIAGLDVGLGGQPGTIGGKVIAPDPTGADVRLMLPADQIGAAQDAEVAATKALPDGTFLFEGVPAPAEYRVEVTLAGYARQTRSVNVDAAETRKDIEIMLRKGDGSIEGSIVGPNGPLGGVQITAGDGAATFTTTALTTDPVGSFVLRDLVTPGTYTLHFEKEGLRSEVLTLRLTEGQRLTGVAVSMSGGKGTINGTVRQAGGGALGGVEVTVSNGQVSMKTTTLSVGSVGAFVVEGLPAPSTYTVSFAKPGYVGQSRSIDLDLLAGSTAATVDAALVPATATLRGTVSDVVGPTGGVTVTVTDGNETRTTTSATSPAGAYLFDGLRPGTYTVTFARAGSASQTFLAPLGPNDTRVIDVTMAQRASITGRITVGPSGGPTTVAEGAEVRLYKVLDFPTTPLARTRVDAAGTYTFSDLAAPDTYVIEAAASPTAVGDVSTRVDLDAGEQAAGVDLQIVG